MVPDPVRALFNPRWMAWRWSVKCGVVALVVLAVLYPRPELLVRNIRHWWDLDALIDPGSPALDELEAELRSRLVGVSGGRETLAVVQDYVVERIPYAWDWETWGVVDYVPTVEETIAAGREDCDGRAVVAASLLRRLGYDAKLRSDLSHVWVWTPVGETMSPVATASGRTLIGPAEKGSKIDWRAVVAWGTWAKDMPTSIAYGIAVFPAWREVVVMVAVCVVMVGRRARLRREAIGAAMLVAGWVVIRLTCADPWDRSVAGAWGGFVLGGMAVAVMAWRDRGPRLLITRVEGLGLSLDGGGTGLVGGAGGTGGTGGGGTGEAAGVLVR